MLHVVRRNKNSALIWAILAVVVFVFVFWGIEAVVTGPDLNVVATVGDEKIEPLEVQRAEFNMVQNYRQALGEQFTPELRQGLNLRQQALDGLIDRAVLASQARELGIEISDAELRDLIVSNPGFQSDGRFDKEVYLRVLRSSRLTPATYEESRRRDLAIVRLQQIIEDGASVDDDEVRAAVREELETRTFRYVIVPTSEFEPLIEVGEEQEETLAALYEENQARYALPETVDATLAVFDPAAFADGEEVAEEEIISFYEENRDSRFTEQEEVRARHILIRVPAGAADEVRAQARGRLEGLRDRIAGGEDFAVVAIASSEDPGSAEAGGDLGFFGRGRMVPAFEEVAFGLEPGVTSEIVESPFGFHLIRVDEVREARTRPIEEVREEVVVELSRDSGKEKARDAAGAMVAGLAEGRSFDELVVETGATLVDPPAIARGAVVEGLGRSIPLTEALFGLADGGTTGVVQVGERQVIGRLDAKNPPKTPALEEVRSRVVADYRRAEAVKQGKAQAEALVAAAQEAGSLDEAAAAAGREVQVSAEVERSGPFVASMGADPELKEAIFSLSEQDPVAGGTFDFLGDAIVVGLGEVNIPSEEEVEVSFAAQREALLRSSRIQLMRRYIDELKAAADVQINTVLLDQLPPI